MACTLEQLQNAECGVLYVLDDVCREHDLRYFLHCGSLLGAVRHQGFIPWDDDADVAIPYRDWRKLQKIYRRAGGHIRGTHLSDYLTDKYTPIAVPKIRLDGSYMPEYSLEKDGFHCDQMDNGVWVDLFVYAFRAKGRLAQKAQDILFRSAQLLHKKYLVRTFGAQAVEKIGETHPFFCRVLLFGARLPDGMRRRLISLLFQIGAALGSSRSGKSVAVCEGLKNTMCIDGSLFRDRIPHRFEDRDLLVPRSYDTLLTQMYGKDYMTPRKYGAHVKLDGVLLPDT